MPILDVGSPAGEGSVLCGSWLDLTGESPPDAQYLCGCEPGDVTALQIAVASSLLNMASGRQFPGLCTDTIRPCLGAGGVQYLAYAGGGSRPITQAQGASWVPAWGCGCGGGGEAAGGQGACTCGGVSLPLRPAQAVLQVKVDGEVLDASEYRLANQGDLLRVNGSWPCRQDLALADTEPGTWSVTYTYGTRPDPAGLFAAGVLVCESVLACNDDDACRLPRRLQQIVREGVSSTVLDPFEFLSGEGPVRFGILEIDSWLSLVNPLGLQRPAKVLHPGMLGSHDRS